MTQDQIYHNIAQRTGGDIYLGVVGPVRSGKSTFIKRFAELMPRRSGRWSAALSLPRRRQPPAICLRWILPARQ